jgi:hypothetical protein
VITQEKGFISNPKQNTIQKICYSSNEANRANQIPIKQLAREQRHSNSKGLVEQSTDNPLYKICSTTNEIEKLLGKLQYKLQKPYTSVWLQGKGGKREGNSKFWIPKFPIILNPKETKISKPPLRCID